jgi:hypothetical protein
VCADGFKLYEKVGEKEIIRDKDQKEKLISKMTESQRAADSILAKSEKLKEHTKKLALEAAKPKPPPVRAPAPAVISTIAPQPAPTVDKATVRANGTNDEKKMRVQADAAKTTPGKRGRPSTSSVPSAKKAKTVVKRNVYLGERVAKVFEQEDEMGQPFQEIYFGNIDRYVATSDSENPLWHVQYDDDDEEEFDEKDVKASLKLYIKEKKNDPNPPKDKKLLPVAKAAGLTPASVGEVSAGKA